MRILYYSLIFLILCSCENEPIGKADPTNVIQVNSELYNLIERAAGGDFENDITCIDFNYAFTLVVYNEDRDIDRYQVINNDTQFSEFLSTLEDGKSISLSYPITSTLRNGETYVINTNEELKEAIDLCICTDTIISCNGILTQESCLWKVDYLDGPNRRYNGAYFEVSISGNVGFNFRDDSFAGTWVTYYIGDSLHLNIFLAGDTRIGDNWNFDWKVINFDSSHMTITNGIDTFQLLKECSEPCRKFFFEECETENGSGRAVFDLESYFDCFFPLTGISDYSSVNVSYYETYEDLIAGINPLVNLMYENSTNPQVIYIRFDDVNTGEYISSLPIILKAINC